MRPNDALYPSMEAVARRLHLSRATLPRAARRGVIAPAFHTPGALHFRAAGALHFRAADIDVYARQFTDPAPLPFGRTQKGAGDQA